MCLLVDVKLPGMDGIALFRTLVRQGADPATVVITGHGDVDGGGCAERGGGRFRRKAVPGNCGEYANVAYTSLVSKTHRVGMNKPKYDHAFVVTCPNDYGDDVQKLYNDNEAMVVDPWWNCTICTFKDFADGHNPYGEKVDPKKNLSVGNHNAATGKPPLPHEFETALNEVIDSLFNESRRIF